MLNRAITLVNDRLDELRILNQESEVVETAKVAAELSKAHSLSVLAEAINNPEILQRVMLQIGSHLPRVDVPKHIGVTVYKPEPDDE